MNRVYRRATGPVVLVSAILILVASCTTTEGQAVATVPEVPVDPGWSMKTVDTSIEVSLPEPFIRLVDLARLRVGMTKAEVLALFPDPYEIELRRGDEFWQYGFAELIFRDGLLRDWFDL